MAISSSSFSRFALLLSAIIVRLLGLLSFS
jgi:hypothetical protein